MLGVAIWCVCGQCPPALKARRLTNAQPPTCSCLPHHCRLADPLLALSPPSIRCEPCRSAILHRHRGWRIPCLCLQPLSPRLRLSPSTRRLHHGPYFPPLHCGPSFHWLCRASQSLQLRIGLSLTILRLGTPLLRLCPVPPALSGTSIPSAPPQSSVTQAPQQPYLRNSRLSHQFHLGPPDPLRHLFV